MRIIRLVLALAFAGLLYWGLTRAFGVSFWTVSVPACFALTAIIGTFTDKDPI